MRLQISIAAVAILASLAASSSPAQPISRLDSFRLGSGAGIICSAQGTARDDALKDVFDRAWSIVCRDAAVPVGRLYALRLRGGDPAGRLAAQRARAVRCGPAETIAVDGLAGVETFACTGDDGVEFRVYLRRSGNILYAAQGFAGYDSALRLGLRSLVAGRPVEGEVSVATTGAGDPAAFARAQAGSLAPSSALAEAYRRNNDGSFAESAEFFTTIAETFRDDSNAVEARINQALQLSNLGRHEEATRLFHMLGAEAGSDPVLTRMLRNYRAIHKMNQGQPAAALAELDTPLPAGAEIVRTPAEALEIDRRLAAELNVEAPSASGLRNAASALLPSERAQIFDGQARHLRGTIARIGGRRDEAVRALEAALADLAAVRGGRVLSTIWMRAQINGELGAIAEQRGDAAGAERLHEAAIALLEEDHPGSPALLGVRARLAGFHARAGRADEAIAIYRQVVDNAGAGDASPALRRALAPYFALLARDGARAESAADMFKASQILVRPGVAQTQAVLARELSGGSDEAARLFRQSVTLGRDIERMRTQIARLAAPSAAPDPARLEALRAQLAAIEADQVATQSKLASFPRYRVVSGGAMSLAELQQLLRPGEAYYKMVIVGDDAYAVYATPATARAFRLGARPAELEREVDSLRATISVIEEGQVHTYPFDAALAHLIYGQLFDPVAADLASVRHLIVEPDGALLRLPLNLLVTDRAGVDAYLAKAARPGDDGFDFTGIAWLGRGRDISTAVSARSFRDVRNVAPSRAPNAYLGFGENRAPEVEAVIADAMRGLLGDARPCDWPLTEWARPISADELRTAGRVIGQRGGGAAEIVTGDAFTDVAIKARSDLSQYRILHFATHGLVAPPRPECPARPALLTSIGGAGSDGLLSFAEIFDLRIDADLVILSACDTAGKASLAATREAGLATGGDFALDGLVRAFVGAGGRSVIASHWPVPDDFNATERLISGLFTAPSGTATASALRAAQAGLMDDPATSHPYYWSGFAIVGDGAAPVLSSS